MRIGLYLWVAVTPLWGAARDVTYAGDVAPILFQHCTGCHHPNDIAPMSLMSYKDARPWAASIREAVASRAMPPWRADPQYGHFSNDMRLSEADVETIRLWVAQGAKEGDAAHTPAAPLYVDDWKIGKPDAVIDIGETHTVDASGPDEYIYFEVPTHFTEDRWVQAAELKPGNRRVVHHAHVWVEEPPSNSPTAKTASLTFTDGKLTHILPDAPVLDNGCLADDGAAWPGKPPQGGTGPLASYLPGKAPDAYPEGTAKLIPAGATLRFQVHYSKVTGKPETDRTAVGLIFAKQPPEHPMRRIDISNYLFRLPPGDANHEVSECHRFTNDIVLMSLTAHMHVRGKSMRFDVKYPDGQEETLLNVPQYSFSWQMTYRLAQPKTIPAGSLLIITAHFDNSANNSVNPNPTKVIRWGEPSNEEMMDGWVEYLDAVPAKAQVYVCPMDPEVRSSSPGKCSRCGMTLVPGIPEPLEYTMEFQTEPQQIPANQDVTLSFRILDPITSEPVTKFNEVHEKLFHLFLVNYDLEYFSHEHPVLGPDGWFRLKTRLPKPGTYRLLADFDPDGGTPQLAAKTFSTAAYTAPLESSLAHPAPDLSPKTGPNLTMELRTEPAQPIAGKKTMLFLHVTPADGLEKYIGAWAHVLAVSSDLIDTMHTHPVVADGTADMQFNLFFPRAGNYRLWIQVQRKGVVNTLSFTVPVSEL